jgi:hypothetical protein
MTLNRASARARGTRSRAEPILAASRGESAVGILVAVTNANDKPWGNAGAILSWGKGGPMELCVYSDRRQRLVDLNYFAEIRLCLSGPTLRARVLCEMVAVPGVRDVMRPFDDFVIGLEQFGTRSLPLVQREGMRRAA